MTYCWKNEQYPYLYDTHVHTKQGSACAKSSGAEMAEAYKKAGYSGIIITDHFFYGNTAIDRKLKWDKWVEEYCRGYEEALKRGKQIGLQVFFGWESGYQGTEFLIYGLDKKWLLEHPQIKDATIEEQYQLIKKEGGIVIHAHPYREEAYIQSIRLFPEYVDGVEVMNACHSNQKSKAHYNLSYDELAYQYAKKHNFIMTAGSDMHVTDLLGGGMAFSSKLGGIEDFIAKITKRESYVLTNGSTFTEVNTP